MINCIKTVKIKTKPASHLKVTHRAYFLKIYGCWSTLEPHKTLSEEAPVFKVSLFTNIISYENAEIFSAT